VALNRAVGHAFAHSVGRPVVIPPSPELLGALGVAILALQRGGSTRGAETDLLALAAQEMKLVGHFTCGACKLYCTISRFEAAGRRFPFGGRCSLFENVWKRKARTAVIRDLVERRAEILFDRSGGAKGGWPRIGIPRALTTHSLYPLYAAFFAKMGMETVLSGVDPRGELKSYSGFCFPAQIAHGAVLDLARQGVDWVFLPHVTHMPQAAPCRESYLCPITQASPYFLAKAFPGVHFLSPELDFTNGYADCAALVQTAVRELDVPPESAERAWAAATRAQTEAEEALRELGRQALEQAVATGEPTILLAGHSYNAFTPEASMSVSKKLTSMGVPVIPADCLSPVEDGPTAWHFSNQILNGMALVQRHPNLFLLCVSNFSCTIDAFTHSMVASGMGAKPYLILEIDGHTADGGVQTRLEAFLDIIRNFRGAKPAPAAEPFVPCRLVRGGKVARSNGEEVALTDPRVKLYFHNFSPHHSDAVAMVLGWLGLRAGAVLPVDRSQLARGLQYTTGRECLPLPICIGQLLEIHDKRSPGEIAGFYMMQGGAPCVSDAYMSYMERFVAEQRLPDLFLFNPTDQNDYCGFDPATLAKNIWPAIRVADLLVEIEQVLHVVGAAGSLELFRRECARFVTASTSLARFDRELPGLVSRLAALPRTRDPLTCPRVVVAGDFFTRFSPFFMEGVRNLYAERGVILKPVDLNDLSLYAGYHDASEIACDWGMKPGFMATALACVKIFRPDGKEYLRNWRAYQAQNRTGDHYQEMFRKTGLLTMGHQDFAPVFEKASEHISPRIFGEVIPSVGEGLQAEARGYDGVFLLGPFNCLPFRISEALLKPLCVQQGMPILTYESDGYAVSASFLRQVEVHIQQVLEHAARSGHEQILVH
jgi:predicted nucleotide-binding protein (sugar kinase/HSP70/actin superfamily)